MKTISIDLSDADYEAFEQAAKAEQRSTAQWIREALATFGATLRGQRPRLRDLPVIAGPRPIAALPTRAEIYDEMFERGARDRS